MCTNIHGIPNQQEFSLHNIILHEMSYNSPSTAQNKKMLQFLLWYDICFLWTSVKHIFH